MNKILVILAHPDDETLFNGTLALLADNNILTYLAYATSGDAGKDNSGENLSGNDLASIREIEVTNALKLLNIKTQPIFLRNKDGNLKNQMSILKNQINDLFDKIKPTIVITFGPDGVTGHSDHITVGELTDYVFDKTDYGKFLLHIAVSKTKSQLYNAEAYNYIIEHPVNDASINLKINVYRYNEKRILAVAAHKTQFNKNDCKAISTLITKFHYEEFIIARERKHADFQSTFFVD